MSKIHHACIDGVSSVDMVEAIHDLQPTPEEEDAAGPWTGEQAPNPLELLFQAQVNTFMQPYRFAEVVARTIPALGRMHALQCNRHGSPCC